MLLKTIPLWPDRSDVTLTTYVTLPDPGWPFPSFPRPGVIICPGGAYLNLSDAEGSPIALEMSARGYQAFVLEYSVGSRVSTPTQTRYPAQLIDLAKAIAALRDNAADWNLDPDNIAIMGFSAGGHLCASYATHWHESWLADAVGTNTEYLRPTAAVLGYPITNYVLQNNAFSEPIPMMIASNCALFGDANPPKEELERLSPSLHVTQQTPPIFLVHASDDGLVPVGNSLCMAQALSTAGVPYELHIFQQGDHGFGNGHPMDRPWEAHRNRACSAWIDLAHTWLLKQFSPDTMEASLPSAEEFFRALEQHHQ